MLLRERYKGVIEWFQQHVPIAETELHYTNSFELLVAIVLSAQCTDKRVNITTPALFKAFPTPHAMANGSFEEVFALIKSISYPNNKAKHLIALAQQLVEKYDGAIPDDAERLQELPGVGRKTANVMLVVAFNKPAMPVDTHVFRVANRIGLTTAKNPLQSEKTLVKNIPTQLLPIAHHWLILHGRYTCLARKPKCEECGIRTFCKFYNKK
jgi:endonuclease III